MKKFLCTLLSAAVVLGSVGVSVAAKEDISVTLNGRYINFDQPPIMQNDRTLVPMRAIFEALGATVSWNDATETVTAVKNDITLNLTIGEKAIYKNGKRITLDVASILLNDRTLVPIRAISESIGADVQWDDYYNKVVITYEDSDNTSSQKCKHEETSIIAKAENDTYINDNNSESHIIKMLDETVCINCKEVLKTSTSSGRENHKFKNGVCKYCGYVESIEDEYENNTSDYKDSENNSSSNSNSNPQNSSSSNSMLPAGVLADYIDGAFLHINVPGGKSIEIPNTSGASLTVNINGIYNVLEISEKGTIETLSYNEQSKKGSYKISKMGKAIIENSGSSDMIVSIPAEHAKYSETSQKVYNCLKLGKGESAKIEKLHNDTIYLSNRDFEWIKFTADKQQLNNANLNLTGNMSISLSSNYTYIITATSQLNIYYCPLTANCSSTSQTAFKEVSVPKGQTVRVHSTASSKSYLYTTNDIYKYDYVTYKDGGKITSQKQDKKGSYISIPSDGYVDFTNKADTDVTIKIPSVYTSYEMQ